MSKTPRLLPGRAYSFRYPRHNYCRLPPGTELRKIVVVSVRDLRLKPLDSATSTSNPTLRRGRWLVTGTDLDKECERSFYFESMSEIRALTEDDLRPLKGVEYVVVEQNHVACEAQRLKEALAFQEERQSGAVCAVLCVAPTESFLEVDG